MLTTRCFLVWFDDPHPLQAVPRFFVPLGRLHLEGDDAAFARAVLATSGPVPPAEPARRGPPVASGTSGDLSVAPLSDRETEILGLLAQRLSNKEIAVRLHITPETVKRHTANIYQKLEVHGRREAAERAGSLGILRST